MRFEPPDERDADEQEQIACADRDHAITPSSNG